MDPRIIRSLPLLLLMLAAALPVHPQYIHRVLEYVPAPGQHINTATGSPHAAGTVCGDSGGMVNLGAFGGYLVFRFEEPVYNDPDNPYGVDFTIFGNPLSEWSEPGIVSVMKDENGNGLPDDSWYELAGSDHHFSSTVSAYRVTYENPGQPGAADVPWYDNLNNTGYIYANSYYKQAYYPSADSFPSIDRDSYTLGGTMIKAVTDSDGTAGYRSYPRAFGYADNRPRGEPPWDIPDNPYTREVENSGGDAFDISWARDDGGNYADLDTVHFIRVHNAVLADAGALGELSTEITGAVDVSPAAGITGVRDMIVIKDLPPAIDSPAYQLEVFVFHRGRPVEGRELNWVCSMQSADVDANNILSAASQGELTITASLADDPEITASASTLITSQAVSVEHTGAAQDIILYPNPATESIYLAGLKDAEIRVLNTAGKVLIKDQGYSGEKAISIRTLPAGIYIISIRSHSGIINKKLIKH